MKEIAAKLIGRSFATSNTEQFMDIKDVSKQLA